MITQSRLRELLFYNPESGVFIVKKYAGGAKVGGVAGHDSESGYVIIKLDGKQYRAHRLAFLYMEGYSPEHEVDHINGDKGDNSWANLRVVSRRCNLQNSKIWATNSSGYKGVSYAKDRKKWSASICINGKSIRIGRYDNPLEAALHRIAFEDCCEFWHCDERCENRSKVFAELNR